MSVANIDSLCDPNIEPCAEKTEMHDFERYSDVNRSMGLILLTWSVAPIVIFFVLVYPWGDSKHLSWLNTYHLFYMVSWYFMIGTHMILFLPQVIVWTFIDNNNPSGGMTSFYSYWLETWIMNSVVAVFSVTAIMFTTVCIIDSNKE